MKTKTRWFCVVALVGSAVSASSIAEAETVATAFTYQGQLKEGGGPVNQTVDFEFTLWRDPLSTEPGDQVGLPDLEYGVGVLNGLFTVTLDFGEGAFTGEARWLEIKVRAPAGGGAFTTLSPRQELTPAPYALALPGLWTPQTPGAPNVIGGYGGNEVTAGAQAAVISGGGSPDDGTGNPAPNRATDHACAIGGGAGNQAGDDGDDPTSAEYATVAGGESNVAVAQLSTIGGGRANQALFHGSTIGGGGDNIADGWWATVGGGRGNEVLASYATIAGGGRTDFQDPLTGNRVLDDHGTIGGGGNNQAGNDDADPGTATFAAVGGGSGNQALGPWCTVGGGSGNVAGDTLTGLGRSIVCGGDMNLADAYGATVCGGVLNEATWSGAFIGGGAVNVAGGQSSVVPGGENNAANGRFSFAMGWGARALHDGAFVWADSDTSAFFESTAENQFLIEAGGGVGINTNSPMAALHIGGTPAVDGLMFPDGTLQTTAYTGGGGSFTLPYAGVIDSSETAFSVTNNGDGGAISGESFGTWAVRGIATDSVGTINYGGYFEAYGSEARAVMGATNGANGVGVYGLSYGTAGRGVYAEATGATGVAVYAESANSKAVDALTSSSSTDPWAPCVYGRNEGAGDGVYGWSQNRHGTVGVTSSTNSAHAGVWAKNNGAGPGILAEGGSGGYAGVFNGWIQTDVVEITGGSDLSERFDITAGGGASKPGMAVCIDPDNPGNLVVSNKPYDRTVAGIISGAGGVAPGMLMGQQGSQADGAVAVALTGRVYCWADASDGPIQPGDLLTTSNTPGHAMKVTDHSNAHGAILGKAMTSLAQGKGLVLVLVTLQ